MFIISSTALGKDLQVKTQSGYLKRLSVAIDSTAATATYYVQFFNKASTPADATAVSSSTPRVYKIVHTTGGNDSELSLDFTDPSYTRGYFFDTGLYVCISSTQFTKTLIGSNVAVFSAEGE